MKKIAVFDDDAAGAEITDELCGGFEFDPLGGIDIALHGAVDDDGLGFQFALHVGTFADCKRGVGLDFAFDFAVENKVVLELEGSFDFHVARKVVAVGCAGGCFVHGIDDIA